MANIRGLIKYAAQHEQSQMVSILSAIEENPELLGQIMGLMGGTLVGSGIGEEVGLRAFNPTDANLRKQFHGIPRGREEGVKFQALRNKISPRRGRWGALIGALAGAPAGVMGARGIHNALA